MIKIILLILFIYAMYRIWNSFILTDIRKTVQEKITKKESILSFEKKENLEWKKKINEMEEEFRKKYEQKGVQETITGPQMENQGVLYKEER